MHGSLFVNDAADMDLYTLSLHDALPIWRVAAIGPGTAEALAAAGVRADLVPERFVAESLLEAFPDGPGRVLLPRAAVARDARSEEHTSELQSRLHLVCRLLLENKKIFLR